jgi:hypothetical protein
MDECYAVLYDHLVFSVAMAEKKPTLKVEVKAAKTKKAIKEEQGGTELSSCILAILSLFTLMGLKHLYNFYF